MKSWIKTIFGLAFLAISPVASADPAGDIDLFNRLMPGKDLLIANDDNNQTRILVQMPALERVKAPKEKLLVACYREKLDADNARNSPVFLAFFKKDEVDKYSLIHPPFEIKGSEIIDHLMKNWVSVIPESTSSFLIRADFPISARNGMHAIFEGRQNSLVLTGIIQDTELEIKDLKKDGEKELVSTYCSEGDLQDPPLIYKVVDGKLMDFGSQFPEVYRAMLSYYAAKLKALPPGRFSFSIEIMLARTYEMLDEQSEADKCIQKVKLEARNDISNLKKQKPKSSVQKRILERKEKTDKRLIEDGDHWARPIDQNTPTD
jgi:hypothetical protein